MNKKKVFIVLTHLHSLKPRTNNEWETTETIEFVDQLREKHYSYASIIGDYVNDKMIVGSRFGMDYPGFDKYIREKYPKQMKELDKLYGNLRVNKKQEEIPDTESSDNTLITDNFGNTRSRTIFDV